VREAHVISSDTQTLINASKVHFTQNPAQGGILLLFLLSPDQNTVICFEYSVVDNKYVKVYTMESEWAIKDFDVVIYDRVAFVIAGNSHDQLNIDALRLKDYTLITDFD
jgi:hypothetical protein